MITYTQTHRHTQNRLVNQPRSADKTHDVERSNLALNSAHWGYKIDYFSVAISRTTCMIDRVFIRALGEASKFRVRYMQARSVRVTNGSSRPERVHGGTYAL